MDIFSKLTEEEYSYIKLAFPKIAALIGTADGEMDKEEKEWAIKITRIRTFSGEEHLYNFYKEIDESIEENVHREVEAHKEIQDDYVTEVANFLSGMNPILAKLPVEYGASLYNDLKSYAQHVAKASGGFMRFFSISGSERKWIDLPMLTPIVWDEEE